MFRFAQTTKEPYMTWFCLMYFEISQPIAIKEWHSIATSPPGGVNRLHHRGAGIEASADETLLADHYWLIIIGKSNS